MFLKLRIVVVPKTIQCYQTKDIKLYFLQLDLVLGCHRTTPSSCTTSELQKYLHINLSTPYIYCANINQCISKEVTLTLRSLFSWRQ